MRNMPRHALFAAAGVAGIIVVAAVARPITRGWLHRIRLEATLRTVLQEAGGAELADSPEHAHSICAAVSELVRDRHQADRFVSIVARWIRCEPQKTTVLWAVELPAETDRLPLVDVCFAVFRSNLVTGNDRYRGVAWHGPTDALAAAGTQRKSQEEKREIAHRIVHFLQEAATSPHLDSEGWDRFYEQPATVLAKIVRRLNAEMMPEELYLLTDANPRVVSVGLLLASVYPWGGERPESVREVNCVPLLLALLGDVPENTGLTNSVDRAALLHVVCELLSVTPPRPAHAGHGPYSSHTWKQVHAEWISVDKQSEVGSFPTHSGVWRSIARDLLEHWYKKRETQRERSSFRESEARLPGSRRSSN